MLSHGSEVLYFVIASPLIAAGMYTDVAARRIGNRLNLAIVVSGVVVHAMIGGLGGVGSSLAGVGIGLAILLPFYVMGAMGAGDVKFLAAIGAWTGPAGCLYALAIGGLLAGVYAGFEVLRSPNRRIHLAHMAMIAGKLTSGRLLDSNYASYAQLNGERMSMPCGAFFGLGGLAVLASRMLGFGVLR